MMLYHKANTEPGNSGSPVIAQKHVIAVHNAGSNISNTGVHISKELLEFLGDAIIAHEKSLLGPDMSYDALEENVVTVVQER